MPKLSELTDYQPVYPEELPVTTATGRIYVSPNMPTSEDGDYFSKPVAPVPELPANNVVERIIKKLAETEVSSGTKIGNKLFGTGGEERYQLWPEKIVRSALTAIPDAYSGKIPMHDVDPETGELVPSQAMISRAMDMSSFAGVGGVGGTGEGAGVALGAGPSLRPALKYKDRLYKGKEGQQHMDVIPPQLYPEFQKMAMNGEDISHYNFGFVNDKGHFLSREDALKYGIDTGLIDPQAGKYGALTSTLLADSSKPGTAIEAMAKTAEPFYSALEHNVKQINQGKMNGEAWLGTLSNKPGVKPEELDWTGLKSFLEENKGKPVTKQQIQEHLAENNTQLNEVWKGGEAGTKAKAFELAKEHGWKSWDEIDPSTQAKYMQRASREAGENPTKYHSYQLPGGENYREMLMTLPERNPVVTHADAVARAKEHYESFPQYGKGSWDKLPSDKQQMYIDAAKEQKMQVAGNNYKSSHWDEPNILAHVRMNDRTIDGKKSLHLEEIQSDWHQQGRDRGYKGEFKEIPYVKPDDLKIVEGPHDWSVTTPSGKKVAVGKGVEKEEIGARDYLTRYINKGIAEANSAGRIAEADRLPDAPFKKTWHELALKRMLREAAEKGYDRLSWTPGEAQAARYDLSKSIDKLQWSPETETLMGWKNGNKVVNQSGVKADKLSDFVGKEASEKLLKTEAKSAGASPVKYHILENADLKIGGEGMKGFYDQIIPKAIEKLGKEHGVKVKQEKINKLNEDEMYNNLVKEGYEPYLAEEMVKERMSRLNGGGTPVYYIDIPQSLKDKAMNKGFPLFSTAMPGYMFKPVDGDPFND